MKTQLIDDNEIDWDRLAKEKIKKNKAGYIDELVTVTSLDNTMNGLLEKLNSYKKNLIRRNSGLSNLKHINLGIHLSAFSIDNIKSQGDIYTVDVMGNVIIYDDKTFHQRFSQYSEKGNYNFHKIKVFDMGFVTKLSGISNFTYLEDVGNSMNDVKWREIDLNTEQGNKVVDFTTWSSATFFALAEGGILKQDGKHVTNNKFPNLNLPIFTNIKFHALSLDHENKILYALDRGGTLIQPNNLWIFYLDNNLDFSENNYQFIKSNSKIYFNNILALPYKNNNVINSNRIQFILVGTQLDNDNKPVQSGYINLYSGHLKYGIHNDELNKEAQETPECKRIDGKVYAMCKENKIKIWDIGSEEEEKAINNCNIASKNGKLGNCKNFVYSPTRSASLILNKLLDKDFTSNDVIFNRTTSDNQIFNLIANNLEELYNKKDSFDADRFINLDINNKTGDIYILLNGVLFTFPINNLGSSSSDKYFDEIIYSENELESLENEINNLYSNYKIILNTEEKLDSKLLSNRNRILVKKVEDMKKEIKRLNLLKSENNKINSEIYDSKIKTTINTFQYLVWIIISIITIILVVINFINPKLLPIPILITYIVFVVIIVIFNRNLFTKI